MKKIVLVISFLIFPLMAFGASDGDTIISVQIMGLKNVNRTTALGYVKSRPGTQYNKRIVQEDCKNLRGSGYFKNATARVKKTVKGIVITLNLTERALITGVKVKGSQKYIALLHEADIAAGKPLNIAVIEALKKKIEEKYKIEGHPYAEVTLDKKALVGKHQVILTIVEGPTVTINEIKFEGNHYYNRLELKLKITSKAKTWPFIDGEFDQAKIDDDVAKIRQLYLGEGFLDVEVSRKLKSSADKTTMDVTFLINEGGRYRINNVIFRGNTVFAGQELAKRLKLQQRQFFTSEALQSDIKTVKLSYGELGYVEASVKPAKRFLSPTAKLPAWAAGLDGGKPSLVNLVYNITERDKFNVGEVIIKGNNVTQDRIIRREVKLYPEEGINSLCNSRAIERTENRLKSLRLFDSVSVTPINSKNSKTKDILVDVKEGRTAEVLLGAGVSSNDGLIGTISLTERNFDIMNLPKSFGDLLKRSTFRGAGQTLNVVAQPGSRVSRYTLGWSTPYIFDKPFSFSSQLYYYDRDYESYELSRVGLKLGVGHLFKNRWRGTIGTRLEGIKVNTDSDMDVPVEVLDDNGDHTLLGLSGGLVKDRTDSTILPSKGDRLSFNYEHVMGDYSFGKFNASYTIYHTLYKNALNHKHILAGRVQFGQIFGDAPTFEKFYGGGVGSIRGFEFRGVSPRGTYANGSPHDDPIGGKTMFLLGCEYTFPLVSDTLRGAVFIDSGTVEEDFAMTTYRVSAGVGVKWKVPLLGPVPMSLNLAFPISSDSNDDTEVFSFTLGARF